MDKYTYKVKVLLECENNNCNYNFTRLDEHFNSNKMTKNDLLNFYDVLYEDDIDTYKPHCPKCDSFLFEEKILDYKEIKEKKRYYSMGVAIDENDRLIIGNDMRILGITLEGTNNKGEREMIDLPLTKDNYIKIYNKAKEYWDNGKVSKYLICFMNNNDKCFQYTRPDKNNFENLIQFEYLTNKRNLDINFDYYNKNYTLSETTNGFIIRYDIDVVKSNINDNRELIEKLVDEAHLKEKTKELEVC